jgi:hypothetical protein
MSGKINIVLAALLVGCALSLVNATCSSSWNAPSPRPASWRSTGRNCSWTSRRWASMSASRKSPGAT